MTTETTEVKFASDRARERARELGLSAEDLANVKPSSKSGITKADVEAHAPADPAAELEGWPSKGYSGPQPWEVIDPHAPEVRALEPGAPNTVAPIVLAHSHPILSSGSGGVEVAELCQLLARLGYPTTVSRGENPFSTLDPSVMAAVRAFRSDYGVREDPASFGGEAQADNHVGPYTWEALVRAAERED